MMISVMSGVMVSALVMYSGMHAALPGRVGDREKLTEKLFDAVNAGNVAAAEQLIEPRVDIDGRDESFWKRPPLQVAIKNKNTQMVGMLLEQKANPNVCDGDGFSSLLHACRELPRVVGMFLENGVRIDNYAHVDLVARVRRCENNESVDGLVAAALIKFHDKCEYSCAENIKDQEQGVRDAKWAMRQALLRKCYLFDTPESEALLVNYGDMLSERELMELFRQSVIRGNKRVTQKLAEVFGESGNYIYYCEGKGDTLLRQAVVSRHAALVDILLKAGHNPNTEIKGDRAPLVMAAMGGEPEHADIMGFLLKGNARLSKHQWRALPALNKQKLAEQAKKVFNLAGPMDDDQAAEHIVRSCPASDCVLL